MAYDGTNSDNEGLAVLPDGEYLVSAETERSILVTPVTPPAAPVRPYILHGCRVHAAPATWLGQPCSKTPARAVPQRGKCFL
jgi:hypothetical protein